jgi:hypothetical protein
MSQHMSQHVSGDLPEHVWRHLPAAGLPNAGTDALLHLPVRRVTPPTVSQQTAAQIAERVAVRAADPAILAEAVAAAARQSRYSELLPWRPASTAQGRAGIAVLCAEFDRRDPGRGWDRAGHHHLAAAAAAASPHDVSLFAGLAGVGFAAARLAAGRPRYARLLKSVDTVLAPHVEQTASRLAAADGCPAHAYDLVSGLTGVGVYLLTRHTEGGGDVETLLSRALSGLAQLLARPGSPRRWHTPADLATGPLRETYPSGHHNCGLAHGAPGPLALLSLALVAGVEVPETRPAIEMTARWLSDHHTGSVQEPDWPDAVPLDPGDRQPNTTPPAGRAAWCYGAPGVARSLWLAGTAVDCAQWRDLAAVAIRAVAGRPPSQWWLSTPTFCHGRAGLLQVLRRFAADLADPALAGTAETLAADLATAYDPASVLGVRAVEPDGVLVDHPGLLDGAPGVALALLDVPAGEDGEPEPVWDRMFLLS